MQTGNKLEIWGGIEGTLNRVGNKYFDQSEYAGYYEREGDIDRIASLGIKMLRYPVLWEKHQPQADTVIDWSFVESKLNRLKELEVEPIAGLVHHGSGPSYVNFFDGSFEQGVANYARMVAEKFPWLQYYTPVNEPLTTARFCGLYGHWYPHSKDDLSFYKILLSECRAVVMAMKAIREINPDAKLIQTEDLGKTYSTPLLKYQAAFENQRRWISYDLLCGRVDEQHPLWNYLTKLVGLSTDELLWFKENNYAPDICGFNYYITSERYLDHRISKYPEHLHGGNYKHRYADIERVRVPLKEESGPYTLLKEAYDHVQLPIAITECHLHCTREEQMRWFNEMWETANELKANGVDIRALTAWAVFGSHGWDKLVTEPWGTYEPGVFNLSAGYPRPTALAKLIQMLTKHNKYHHPVLETAGWWKRDTRLYHTEAKVISIKSREKTPDCQPLLIIGKSGMLANAISRICALRNIHHVFLGNADITNMRIIEEQVKKINPWAIVNATGYEDVDNAENEPEKCINMNCKEASVLAEVCMKHHIKLVSFSSDLVFGGNRRAPYVESNETGPLNVYGQSKRMAEVCMLRIYPSTLIIRTGNLFSPWDESGFVANTLAALKQDKKVAAAVDVHISPTYVPDLVQQALDSLLDNEHGIFHLANRGSTTWAGFALKIAEMAGCDTALVQARPAGHMPWKAKRPPYSVLESEKGIRLPSLDDAMQRYFEAVANVYLPEAIAV